MWDITFWAPLVALSCPSVHVEQLDSHLTDFDDFLYCGAGSGSFNKNISKKTQIRPKSDNNKSADVHTCATALASNVTFVTVDNNR